MSLFRKLKTVWEMLDNEYKNKFIILQFFILFASMLEVFSLVGIGPFVSVILGVIQIEDIPIIGNYIVSNYMGIEIYALGCFVGSMILLSNMLFAITLYKKAKFSYGIGAQTSNRIVEIFLSDKSKKDLISKDDILSNATFESDRFAKGVLNEIMQINARATVGLFITTYLLYSYGISFLIIILYLVGVYFLLSIYMKKKLILAGQELTKSNKYRLRNINDLYDCFYEIKSYQAEKYFYSKQKKYNKTISENLANIELYSVLPRYLVEGMIFLSLIIVMSYYYAEGIDINTLIPAGATLIYGVMKLIPQISNIYQAYSNFSGNYNSVNTISKITNTKVVNLAYESLHCDKIILDNLIFQRDNHLIFDNFNYSFKKNNIYAIKGPSGVGKSTMLSLLFGSLKPSSGTIKFTSNDNEIIKYPKIAMIPQQNHLVFGDIQTNIAFGISKKDIDSKKIQQSLKKINLEELLNSNTEFNIKLSGGQVQRVSIGRFLYHNYDIVLLDEPTSALDMKNQKIIFELLQIIKKDKIIIMVSHSELADHYSDKIIRLG